MCDDKNSELRCEAGEASKDTGMTWAQAYAVMVGGGMVRRKAWAPVVEGVERGMPRRRGTFFRLVLRRGSDNWQPYVEDFVATDWQVVRIAEEVRRG